MLSRFGNKYFLIFMLDKQKNLKKNQTNKLNLAGFVKLCKIIFALLHVAVLLWFVNLFTKLVILSSLFHTWRYHNFLSAVESFGRFLGPDCDACLLILIPRFQREQLEYLPLFFIRFLYCFFIKKKKKLNLMPSNRFDFAACSLVLLTNQMLLESFVLLCSVRTKRS